MGFVQFRQFIAAVMFGWFSFVSSGAVAAVVTGNSNGNIVVEEFFDYQCPHCRIMLENTEKVAQNNPNIKLITRVIPLMDRTSWFVARAVLAARNQGKYAELHHLLMQQRETISEVRVFSLAKTAGINVAQLRRDMRSKEIAAELNANITASRARGVDVIPAVFAYRINNRSAMIRVVGDKTSTELQESIASL